MALGDAKSGRDVDSTLSPDSRLAFRRPGRQTHVAHRTQGIIFADEDTNEFYQFFTEMPSPPVTVVTVTSLFNNMQ